MANSDSDEDDMGLPSFQDIQLARKEATRTQRISEGEQRRRDEVRDGFARLREVFPQPYRLTRGKVMILERG